MKRLGLSIALFLSFLVSNGSAATLAATGQIRNTSLGGGLYNYTITLNNTGTGGLETFWFAWVPGENFLATNPTNIVSPTNWSANITHGGAGDGYGIQWLTSTAPLAAGSSLNFSFQSTDIPTAVAGNSVFYPTTPVGTSFIYSGGPFSDSGYQFVVASVPEPSDLCLLALVVLMVPAVRLSRRFFYC